MEAIANTWADAQKGGHVGALATEQLAGAIGEAIATHAQGIAQREGIEYTGVSGRSR